MKKTINVTAISDGQKYFSTYKVMCVKYSGETVIYGVFLTYELAQKTKAFVYEAFSNLYRCCYVIESLVWC